MSLGVPEEEQLWAGSVAEGRSADGPLQPPGQANPTVPAAAAAPPQLRQLSPRQTGGHRPSGGVIPEDAAVVGSPSHSVAAAAGGLAGAGAAAGPGPPAGAPADSRAGGDAAAAAAEARESAVAEQDEEEKQLPRDDLPPPADERGD